MATILIVEDNDDLRALLADHLMKFGYNSMAVTDFKEVNLKGKPFLLFD